MTIEATHLIGAAMVTGAALAMGFGAIGAGIGEGIAAGRANEATARSPKHSGAIFKNMLVGQAVAESAAIFALVIAMMLLFSVKPSGNILQIFILISSGACMGLGAIGAGIGSGYPTGSACVGIARQPLMSGKLTTNMLIGSAVCQTPAIFSLVVAFILMFAKVDGLPVNPYWAAYLGAGLATGLAAVGSGLGGGLVADTSCESAARQPRAGNTVLKSMLLGQAVTQTTAIYGLLVSFVLLFKGYEASTSWAVAAALLGAGLCMGLGAIGPGAGEGLTARSAVKWIGRNVGATGELTRTMLVGMAVAESTGIYALVVSLVLIFVI